MYALPRLSLVLALLVGCTPDKPPADDSAADPSTTDADSDGSFASEDCDDANAAVFPGADELCNDLDDDCDGAADEDAIDVVTMYADVDGDGYGDPDGAIATCDAPPAHVENADDCNDADGAISPAAQEVCDDADVDEDCSGAADDADTGVDLAAGVTRYADADGDGYGDDADTVVTCDAVDGRVDEGGDCDDADAAISPAATELCDAADVDEDCDGATDDADTSVDSATATTWYEDADGDGYGAIEATLDRCDLPTGYVADASDCDDTSADISPAGVETCDDADVDEDCDGRADNDDPGARGETTWYADADGDTFGDRAATSSACDQPEAYVADSNDCDDAAGTVYPGAAEQCDGIANDCDTLRDWTADLEAGVASWEDASGWSAISDTLGAGTGDGAVVWSAPGDGELHLCDGVWYAQIDGSGVSLTISGLNGAETTILDGGGSGTVVSSTGGTLSIEGVTIQNGSGSNGGGVYCLASDLTIADSIVESNIASSSGGGIFLQACTDATLADTTLAWNTASSGGGLYATSSDGLVIDTVEVSSNDASTAGGGIVLSHSDFTMADSTVSQNAAGGSYSAGGLSVSSSTGTIESSTVSSNTAATAAGLLVSVSTVDIVDSTVSANVSSGYGGALHAYYTSTVSVRSTTFSENVAGSGGTIYLDTNTSGTFTSCTFSSNVGEDAGVFAFTGTSSASIVTSDFADNVPADAYAGGTAYTFGTGASMSCDDSTGCY